MRTISRTEVLPSSTSPATSMTSQRRRKRPSISPWRMLWLLRASRSRSAAVCWLMLLVRQAACAGSLYRAARCSRLVGSGGCASSSSLMTEVPISCSCVLINSATDCNMMETRS